MKRQFKNYPAQYVECRVGRRHAWDEIDPSAWPAQGVRYLHGLEECSRCSRCTMLKRRVISIATGEVLTYQRRPPKGYSIARDEIFIPDDMTLGDLLRMELSAQRKAQVIKAREAKRRKARAS